MGISSYYQELIYILLVVVYLIILVMFIRSYTSYSKKKSTTSSSGKRPKKKRYHGKKCPECGNTINENREVCQHCGYKFKEKTKSDPRPQETELPKRTEADTEQSTSQSRSKKGGSRRKGKRCPQCQKLIDYRRAVCQHCGYKFTEFEELEVD
jgi:uncharacterized OB-fold protein